MQIRTISFLMYLMFVACGTSDDMETMLSDNSFVAQRDDQSWEGTTEIGLTANDTLVFLAVGNGLDNGVMVAKIKFEGTGLYNLNSQQGIYYNTLGGDVLISRYSIIQEFEGTFSISAYDEANRQVEGSFELPLKASRLTSPDIKDSTLTITDGRFKGSIREGILH